MKLSPILLLLCSACTADVFSGSDDSSPPESSDAASVAPSPSRFARLAPDAGDADDAGCVLLDHWDGYYPFQSCETSYSETLAMQACATYFGAGCQPMPDAGCGPNVVGKQAIQWILWSWTADAGLARESANAECPGQPGDPAWW